MSEAKHTPKPWHVAYYADETGGASHYAVKKGQATILRTVNQVADNRDEADATLASAAPDLLVVAEWVIAADDAGQIGGGPEAVKLVAAARAAIAKAEGR